MGGKRELFMVVTAILSVAYFNFKMVLRMVLCWVCTYVDDAVVPCYGPYMYVRPITVDLAMVDGEQCTNKINLLLNWYWDTDIDGVILSNILVPGRKIAICYKKKFSSGPEVAHTCMIEVEERRASFNGEGGKDVIFEELKLL